MRRCRVNYALRPPGRLCSGHIWSSEPLWAEWEFCKENQSLFTYLFYYLHHVFQAAMQSFSCLKINFVAELLDKKQAQTFKNCLTFFYFYSHALLFLISRETSPESLSL
jgi:hypothetical protein